MEETIARLFQVFLALAGAYTLALWFALAVWTYRDINARTTNPVVQIFSTLLVVLFSAPGAIIYLILRPRETLDEAFQRSIEEEYLVQDLEEFPLCPSCRRPVRDDFVYCPHCHVELRRACANCRRMIDLRWEICPYCGVEQFQAPLPVLTQPEPDEAPVHARRATVSADSGSIALRPQPTLDEPETRPHWERDGDEPLVTPLPNGAGAQTRDGRAVSELDDEEDGITPPEEFTPVAARGRGSARRRAGSDN